MEGELNMALKSDSFPAPQLIAVVDLGERNEGTISSSHLPEATIQSAIDTLTSPDVKKPVTKRWRCVDGRGVVGDERTEIAESDPQIAGGIAINETSVDIMLGESESVLSSTVVKNTKIAIGRGQTVVVHGDNHTHGDEETNKGGCGANAKQRETLRKNAANADVLTPIITQLATLAEVHVYFVDENALVDEINTQITNGLKVAEDDSFWDVTPEEVYDLIVENGGQEEELDGDHLEAVAEIDLSEDGTKTESADFRKLNNPVQAFIASIGEYKKTMFEAAETEGKAQEWAARRVIATLLANSGTLKLLTKDIDIVLTK